MSYNIIILEIFIVMIWISLNNWFVIMSYYSITTFTIYLSFF